MKLESRHLLREGGIGLVKDAPLEFNEVERVIVPLDDVMIIFQPLEDFEPEEDDLVIDIDSVNATANRLEPDMAAEFVRSALELKRLIPADEIAEAAADKNTGKLTALLNRTVITQAFDKMAGSVLEAVKRGQRK